MKLDPILGERDTGKFIYDLAGYVTDPDVGGVVPEDLQQAPPLVKGMIYLRAFDLTTVNSGMYKWFIEDYEGYPNLAKFFDKIGAKKAADYIRTALTLFPGRRIPKDLDARFAVCDAHHAQLFEIDQRFEGASEEAIGKLRDYIISHKKAFEAQVKSYWKIRRANHRVYERRLAKLRRKELGR